MDVHIWTSIQKKTPESSERLVAKMSLDIKGWIGALDILYITISDTDCIMPGNMNPYISGYMDAAKHIPLFKMLFKNGHVTWEYLNDEDLKKWNESKDYILPTLNLW
jgi:hypothetical protein